ncbi:MAG: AIR synthase family protein [Anaerovoracaceae bacterium]|jgi:hydrogenase expression/formation protein HypE|nr:AIR synthase family protein [Anaerovoracaceae bacterium]
MLKTGKLESALLEELVFKNITWRRPEVLTRPGIGEDCAVIDFGNYECILSTDPITAAVKDIGRLAVHISCNDIAANGVEPLGLLLAIMLPEGTKKSEINEIMAQAGKASQELGVEIIGGHTEVTPAVTKPVIVSTAIGRGAKWSSQNAENMVPGDLVYVTKSVGLEGAGIISMDREEELKDTLSREELEKAKGFIELVSVVREGVLAGKIGTNGMHDITEGGVLGSIWEMCQIAKMGAEIHVDKIPVEDVTKKICETFDIDYLRLISSGSMMIMVSPEKKAKMEEAMEEANIPFTLIGTIKPLEQGVCMVVEGEYIEIASPATDEIYKALK